MCSVFDLGGCFASLWAMLPWWVTILPWIALGILVLWALSKVKEIAGWPGVAGVAGVLVYLAGYWRGRHGESIVPVPHEHVAEDSPDAAPAPSRRPRDISPHLPPDPPRGLTQ